MRKDHLIYLLIFLSGFAGLIYEIVWTRHLTLLFGVSIHAVSAVVAVFLLGLAAGSYLFGRAADRAGSSPLIIFGIIELSVAGYALTFPLIARMIQHLHTALYDNDFSLLEIFFLRFMLTFILLIPPTLLMGGTLPVAGKLCSRLFNRFGNALAKLYGLNTLGGLLGAALAGFFLLRWLGARQTAYVAVVCNGAAGAAALWMSRYGSPGPHNADAWDRPAKSKREKAAAEGASSPLRRQVLVIILISGFCALGYEVLWTKMLILIMGNSSWAFSTVLVVFLASIAAGSLFIAPWLDRKFNRIQLFSLLQVLIAITAFLSLLTFRWLAIAKSGGQAAGLVQIVLSRFFKASIMMAPPTLMSGAILPLAARLYASGPGKAGTQFGLTLAFNTAGSVLGSLAAGYFFISLAGIQNSIILLAVLNGILGVWLLHIKVPQALRAGAKKKGASWLVVYVLILTLFLDKPPLTLPPPGYDMRYYKEDAAGIVSIYREQSVGTKIFNINNVNEVTTHSSSMITFRLMAYLPYMLHENPRDALVITFGAGIVAGSLAQLDFKTLDCVEINPNARDVGRFFAAENHNAITNPKLSLYIEDGRNFLSTTSQKYDIITADATHPTAADSWILFTKEYYELCRQHLGTGGVFLQWLPLHALSTNYYLTILATASEVFEDLSVWFTGLDGPIGHTLMIGAMNSLAVDFEQVRQKMQLPAIRGDLAKLGIHSPESLLSHFLTNKDHLLTILQNRAMNTDNLAITAFPDAVPSPERWAKNLALLAAIRTSPMIVNAPADTLRTFERLNRVSGWLIDAALAASAGDFRHATAWIDRIETADIELEKLSSAFSSSAQKIIEKYLAKCEQAVSAADTASALLYIEKVHPVNAVVPESYLRMGRLYKQLGQFEKAFMAMKQATQATPSSESFFELGTLALEMGKLQQAITAYQAALRHEPDLAIAYTNLGTAYVRMGEYQKAQETWENALERSPDDQLDRGNLIRLLARLKIMLEGK